MHECAVLIAIALKGMIDGLVACGHVRKGIDGTKLTGHIDFFFFHYSIIDKRKD
jgi:hypothetical protein